MKKLIATFAVSAALTGCTTLSSSEAIPPLQTATAKMLGLASSDEITVSRVSASAPGALGAQALTYRATTARGRIFDCTSTMTPGLLTTPPALSVPACTAVKAHD